MDLEPARYHSLEPLGTAVDDEISALGLQLEELQVYRDADKRKYIAGRAPDIEVALSVFQEDIQRHVIFLGDLLHAHSIARAVDADARAIASAVQDEIRGEEDRRLAAQMSDGNHEQDSVSQFAEMASPRGFHLIEVKYWTVRLVDVRADRL
jgi:hypothetical protein